jgi:hypothetical protein
MVLTGSFVISPVTGLCCHRHQQNHFRQLDASVGASGPHDFAVRFKRCTSAAPKRPSHPAPNVRDDREAPLMWDGMVNQQNCFYQTAKRNIFAARAGQEIIGLAH